MRGFKQYLLSEKAKTLTKSAYEQLLLYKDREDIFITLTEVNKVGINPNTSFDTPNGIYTYPLKEFWIKYKMDKTKSIRESSPFAGDRKYIQVLQLVDDSHFINDLKSEYFKIDYERDIEKLKKVYVDEEFLKNGFGEILELFAEIYNESKILDMDISKLFMYFKERNILNPGENNIFIYFKNGRYSNDKRIKRILEIVKKNYNTLLFYWVIGNALEQAKDTSSYGGLIWYVTYRLSDLYSYYDVGINDKFGKFKTAQRWNNMMRYLGYDGVADRSGVGIIHENEPLQAVFFSVKPIKHIDTIINKDDRIFANKDSMNIFSIYEMIKKGIWDRVVDNENILKNVISHNVDFSNKKEIELYKKIIEYLFKNEYIDKDTFVYCVSVYNNIEFNKEMFNKYIKDVSYDVVRKVVEANNYEFFKYLYSMKQYPKLLDDYRIDYDVKNENCVKIIKEIINKSDFDRKAKKTILFNMISNDSEDMFYFLFRHFNIEDDEEMCADISEFSIRRNRSHIYEYILKNVKFSEKNVKRFYKLIVRFNDVYLMKLTNEYYDLDNYDDFIDELIDDAGSNFDMNLFLTYKKKKDNMKK